MKILQINKFYYLKGGAERYMFDVSKLLEKKGHTVIPFSMQSDKNYSTPYSKYFFKEVNLDKFGFLNILKIFYNYDALRRLKKLIRDEQPEVAHLHNIYYQVSPAIIKLLKKNNIRVVLTMHDYFMVCPNYQLFCNGQICHACLNGSLMSLLKQKCIKNSFSKSLLAYLEYKYNHNIKKYYDLVDEFIAPSQYMKDVCVAGGVNQDKIRVNVNFVDPLDKEDEPSDYLLYYGRVSREKGVDKLIKAYKESKQEYNLHIVGEGEEKDTLVELIKSEQLEDKIKILGAKYDNDLENEISKAKAVVIPSIWPENMPYVLLESLARGKGWVASEGWAREEFMVKMVFFSIHLAKGN